MSCCHLNLIDFALKKLHLHWIGDGFPSTNATAKMAEVSRQSGINCANFQAHWDNLRFSTSQNSCVSCRQNQADLKQVHLVDLESWPSMIDQFDLCCQTYHLESFGPIDNPPSVLWLDNIVIPFWPAPCNIESVCSIWHYRHLICCLPHNQKNTWMDSISKDPHQNKATQFSAC